MKSIAFSLGVLLCPVVAHAGSILIETTAESTAKTYAGPGCPIGLSQVDDYPSPSNGKHHYFRPEEILQIERWASIWRITNREGVVATGVLITHPLVENGKFIQTKMTNAYSMLSPHAEPAWRSAFKAAIPSDYQCLAFFGPTKIFDVPLFAIKNIRFFSSDVGAQQALNSRQ